MVNDTYRALRAAALVVLLVLVGAVASEAGNIYCLTNGIGAGTNTCRGFFDPAGEHSNTWFFSGPGANTPTYSFTISGTPQTPFAVDVGDHVLASFNVNYPGVAGLLACVPTFATGYCGVFNVTSVPGTAGPSWAGAYYDVSVFWNVPPGNLVDPQSPRVTILKAPTGNYAFSTAVMLTDIWYDPNRTAPDPGIGGKGDTFSTFGVFAGSGLNPVPVIDSKANVVPEPASMVLLGTGLAGLVVRARRRKK